MKGLRCLMIAVLPTIYALSCLKKDFERPPDLRHFDPELPVTHTIAELKAMNGFYDFRTGGDTTLIKEDVVIAGIVTADDRSGNFYKRIVMEDATGGIAVLLDAYNLYNDYPVGRRVYVKARGLYLGYDGGLPVLGGAPSPQLSLSGIPAASMADYLTKGSVGHELKPVSRSLTQVADADPSLYNRLVTIEEAEFADTGVAYTQPNATTNREIANCTGGKIAVRTSNYASFAGVGLPTGKGTITGIYTVYTSTVSGSRTPQLVIRDTNDVQFHEPRCSSGPAAVIPVVPIDSIRRLAPATGTAILGNYRVRGIVISDRINKNIDSRNLVLQDGDRGIVVRFSATHAFNLGDSLEIDISGAQLGRYNGLLQVGALNSGSSFRTQKATRLATGKSVTPAIRTIAAIIGPDFERYESVLVRIMNVETGGGVYAGNKELSDASDASGGLKLYTAASASFAQQQMPPGKVHITGIIGVFGNTKQLCVRSPADVQ